MAELTDDSPVLTLTFGPADGICPAVVRLRVRNVHPESFTPPASTPPATAPQATTAQADPPPSDPPPDTARRTRKLGATGRRRDGDRTGDRDGVGVGVGVARGSGRHYR